MCICYIVIGAVRPDNQSDISEMKALYGSEIMYIMLQFDPYDYWKEYPDSEVAEYTNLIRVASPIFINRNRLIAEIKKSRIPPIENYLNARIDSKGTLRMGRKAGETHDMLFDFDLEAQAGYSDVPLNIGKHFIGGTTPLGLSRKDVFTIVSQHFPSKDTVIKRDLTELDESWKGYSTVFGDKIEAERESTAIGTVRGTMRLEEILKNPQKENEYRCTCIKCNYECIIYEHEFHSWPCCEYCYTLQKLGKRIKAQVGNGFTAIKLNGSNTESGAGWTLVVIRCTECGAEKEVNIATGEAFSKELKCNTCGKNIERIKEENALCASIKRGEQINERLYIYTGYTQELCTRRSIYKCRNSCYFVVKIIATDKYTIMPTLKIAEYAGEELEVTFDEDIWGLRDRSEELAADALI
jgi:hypothetical protein